MHALASVHSRRAVAGFLALALSFVAVVLVAPAAHAASQNYNVDSLTDDGVGNTLREAVTLANANSGGIDTITIAVPGTITLTAGPITITDGVTISGLGTSTTITRGGDQGIFVVDLNAATPLVDRNIRLEDLIFQGASPLTGVGLYVEDTELLDTLTILNSTFNDFDGAFEGGALRVEALTGGVQILGSTFGNNDATAQGGAIMVTGAPDGVYISGSSLVNNSATNGGNGGALVATNSGQITFVDSTVSGNSSVTGGGAAYLLGNTRLLVGQTTFTDNASTNNRGGAISVDGGANGVLVEGSTFTGNTADNDGGALNVTGVSELQVTGSTFTDNVSGGAGGALNIDSAGIVAISTSTFTLNSANGGGALNFANLNAILTIDHGTFNSNSSTTSGGAIQFNDVDESATVSESSFTGNGADEFGGGVFASVVSNELLFSGDTFTENFADFVGTSIGVETITGSVGVFNSTFLEQLLTSVFPIAVIDAIDPGAGLVLFSSTLVGNGGIAVFSNDGLVLVSNSIVDDDVNVLPFGPFFLGTGDPFSIEWSILTSAFDSTTMVAGSGNQFSADPKLGSLANNGGPTRTMLPLTGSPAINLGDPAYGPSLTEDQRGAGFARIVQGRVDIGAVETQLVTLAATGLEISPLLPIGGALLLLAGIALFVVARRRRAA